VGYQAVQLEVQLLCGRPPFNGKNDEDIMAKVRTGE
jgi:hypothetical protein